MGLFMDTLEDNLERTGQYLDVLVLPQKPVGIDTFPQIPPLVHCPLCGEVVIAENDLKQHFMDKHANRYAYLLVDGKIVRDAIYTDSRISSLIAHLINIPRAKIKIEASGLAPVEMDFSEEISIMEYLRNFQTGEINIAIHLPGSVRQYSIYCGTLPEIGIEEIDRASSDYLYYPLNENKEPNWSLFQKSFSSPERHRLERQYADGLYEYAVGVHMVQIGQDGKDRLESALGNLSPFRTPYAVTIQRVLALRMNLFGLLQTCMYPSRFAAANDFFNLREMRLSRKPTIHNDKGFHDYGYAVYIDPFTEMFIDALHAYYNKDYRLLDDLCNKLDSLCHGPDRNNRDKLFLLRARTCLKRNDIAAAQSFYQRLIENPDFKRETREALNGTPKNSKN